MKWFYLAFIVLNFISAAIFLLFPKLRAFWGGQRSLWLAPLVVLPALFSWDYVGHSLGWWRFTSSHLTGWTIGSLPVEELAFLYGIPFACLVVWGILRKKTT